MGKFSDNLQAVNSFVIVDDVTKEYIDSYLTNASGGANIGVGRVITSGVEKYKRGTYLLFVRYEVNSQYFGEEIITVVPESAVVAVLNLN